MGVLGRVPAPAPCRALSGGFNGSFLSNDEQQALLQLTPIRPEKVTAYEIGEKATFFDRRLRLDAAAFYNDYSNEQIFASVPQLLETGDGQEIESTTQLLTNARKAHTDGVEVQATATPVRGLTLDLEPAWLQARLDDAGLPLFTGATSLDGKQLANAPRFSFTGTASYRYVLATGAAVSVRWNANYRSHTWFDATNDPYIQQSGYWLHNVQVAYESSAGWELGAFVRNAGDRKYNLTSTDLVNPFGLLEPVEGAPRMYGVELTYHR